MDDVDICVDISYYYKIFNDSSRAILGLRSKGDDENFHCIIYTYIYFFVYACVYIFLYRCMSKGVKFTRETVIFKKEREREKWETFFARGEIALAPFAIRFCTQRLSTIFKPVNEQACSL